MSQFKHLPTDILLHLFNTHFHLKELLQLRVLNLHIRSLIEYCLSTRKSLKLFWSYREVESYSTTLYTHNLHDDPFLRLNSSCPTDDDLILDPSKLSHSTVDRLAELFPALEHLLIYTSHTEYVSPYSYIGERRILSADHYTLFPYLISCWPKLLHLSLFGEFNALPGTKVALVRNICSVINNLSCLKRLDLCSFLMFYYYDRATKTSINIPIELDRVLLQLDRFYWALYEVDDEEAHMQVLRKLGTDCSRLNLFHQFQISNTTSHEIICQTLEHLMTLSPNTLTSSITHLTVQLSIHHRNRAVLGHIAQLTELHSLGLHHCLDRGLSAGPVPKQDPSSLPLNAILSTLRKLRLLNKLHLSGFQLDPLVNATARLQALPSIANLTIEPSIALLNASQSAKIFEILCLAFPAIRTLRLKQSRPLPVDPIQQLAFFKQLTRFELSVYMYDINPLMLSRKYLTRYEQTWGKLKLADRIVPDEQYGRQTWTRKDNIVEQAMNNDEDNSGQKYVWTKDDALVWDWPEGRYPYRY